ncbi:hypothetical protein ACFOKJ_00195 [Vogesella amnigena]|uniref:Uncharacterized protein n=1 Tax=Vogesella amnigena TaxID=1507449 RepID=A0ABV7TMR8_9NEIS
MQHHRNPVLLLLCALVAVPASAADPAATAASSAGSLLIDQQSLAGEVLRNIPAGAALERFVVANGPAGRLAYVGLTEGDTGGVVFVNDRLAGVVSRRLADAFYSCRGFATANQQYWGKQAGAWVATLQQQMQPASSVQLVFSGKSALQSIQSIVENPLLGQLKSLLDMGTNPLNIFKTLNKSRQDLKQRAHDDEVTNALAQLQPGDEEARLAAILLPEEVNFLGEDLVMAYPRYSVDYLVQQGRISLQQQPSFLQLSRGQAALFYRPGVQWSSCTPADWPSTAG